MTFFDRLNLPKFDLTQKLSGRQIAKFPNRADLTSQRVWSIVLWLKKSRKKPKKFQNDFCVTLKLI